jgi:hypothetical protein
MTIPSSCFNKNLNTIPPIYRVQDLAKPRSTTNATKQSNQNKNDRKNATATKLDTKSVALGVVSLVALGATIVSCVLWSKNKKLESPVTGTKFVTNSLEYQSLQAEKQQLQEQLRALEKSLQELAFPTQTGYKLCYALEQLQDNKKQLLTELPRNLLNYTKILSLCQEKKVALPQKNTRFLEFFNAFDFKCKNELRVLNTPVGVTKTIWLPEKGYVLMPFEIPQSGQCSAFKYNSDNSYIFGKKPRRYHTRLLNAYEFFTTPIETSATSSRLKRAEYVEVNLHALSHDKDIVMITFQEAEEMMKQIKAMLGENCLGFEDPYLNAELGENFLTLYLKSLDIQGVYLYNNDSSRKQNKSRLYLFDKPDITNFIVKN